MLCVAPSLPAAPVNNPARPGTSQTDDPANSLHVPNGFRAELAVTTAAIGNPSAITFDENGRLFALEPSGEVLLLSDTNNTGRYATATIFADNIASPTALACANRGLFVAAGNRVLFLQDTNGDGVADINRMVLSSGNKIIQDFVRRPDGQIIAVGAGFSFDPRTMQVSPELSIGEQGLCLDEQGRAILCAYGQPFQTVMYDSRYTTRNDLVFLPNPLEEITGLDDAVRVPGDCLVYRGLLPTNHVRSLLIADPERHAIHSLRLQDDGLEITAQKPDADFVTSEDEYFNPKQIVAGPGGIYIVDGLTGRYARGRIWRLMPTGVAWTPPKLGSATTYDLVASLGAVDSWRRDTAARLLCERRDPAALPLLGSVLRYAKAPESRLAALQILSELGGLTEDFLTTALQDKDERVRAKAVLISEKFIKNRTVSFQISRVLFGMVQDPSEWVRYQLAFTLGEISSPQKTSLLAGILYNNPADEWIQTAVLSSLGDSGGQFFTQLASNQGFRESAAGAGFLERLLGFVGVQNRPAQVTTVLRFIKKGEFPLIPAYTWLRDLADALRRGGSSLGQADPGDTLADFYQGAFFNACDDNADPAIRVASLRLFEVSDYDKWDAVDHFMIFLVPAQPVEVQLACIHAIARYNVERIADFLIQRRGVLAPSVQADVIASLLTRNDNVKALLTALEQRKVLFPSDFSSVQVDYLRNFGDQSIQRRAINIFGAASSNGVERVKEFTPALKLAGVADRGRAIFENRCASCHAEGRFGPRLAYNDDPNREKILSDIVNPSAEIARGYSTHVVELRDGEKLVGLLSDPSAAVVVLRESNGAQVLLPQYGTSSIERQNWSLMPEEAVDGLSPRDMADLIEYVAGLR